jgi:hypothetical protein
MADLVMADHPFSHQPGVQSMNAQSMPVYNSLGSEGRTGSAPQGMQPYPGQHMYQHQAPAHGSSGPMQVSTHRG